MKTILITGVTGQAGSYFSDYLLEKTDYKVYGMVRRLSVPNHKNISHLKNSDRFELISGDLTDGESIYFSIDKVKPDFIINAAAQSFVAESWNSPINTFQADAVGIIYLLESMRKIKPTCRFVNFGSSEEMGDVVYNPQDEMHPSRARSVYGAAKIAARQIIKVYRESYNLFAIQPWMFNYESKRRGIEFITQKIAQGVGRIKKALNKNLEFEPIHCGNIYAKRDWGHALDVVDAIWKMLNNSQPKEYVVSTGQARSIKEFTTICFNKAGINGYWQGEGLNEQLIFENKPLVIIDSRFYRPADVEFLCGNSDLIKKELNWQPQYTFEMLVQEMVENAITENS